LLKVREGAAGTESEAGAGTVTGPLYQ